MSENQFDIIIAGSGLSGLSLAFRAFKTGTWKNESVLIVDKDTKNRNDRTWCFWQKETSPFEEVVYHKWNDFLFYSNDGEEIKMDSAPYQYKMVRGVDFYKHTIDYLKSLDNVTFINENIESIRSVERGCELVAGNTVYRSRDLFNSIYKRPELKAHQHYFLQHFKGWVIDTDQFQGDPEKIHFMDYRTSQENGLTFVYVLPFSQNKLLVEYTLFTKQLLEQHEYDEKLKEYLKKTLGIESYKIEEKEFGIIPMTDYQFMRRDGNVMNIGSIGGDTRGSSGYTFANVQTTIGKILDAYKRTGQPFFSKPTISFRHQLYDQTILNVFDKNRYEGHQIFTDLFTRTRARDVFAFLDSESSVLSDIRVMKSLRTYPFARAFFKSILSRI